MVSIQPTTASESYDDGRPWLVFVERSDNQTVTLDLSLFLAAHRDGNYVKSGLAIAAGVDGLYGPVATGGELVLFQSVYAPAGVERSTCAGMARGTVDAAFAPVEGSYADLPSTIRVLNAPAEGV